MQPHFEITDTHAHLDGPEFSEDLGETMARAGEAGVARVFIPGIDLPSSLRAREIAAAYLGKVFPMIGLHPEEVKADYKEKLAEMRRTLEKSMSDGGPQYIAIGEVGLDFYWSREFENEQMAAFEEQVGWAADTGLPLMIHCRKAQQQLVSILGRHRGRLHGGVFHCFTGNGNEARELLAFQDFALGIGGVLTFKNSKLPETLPANVPLGRIVIETDSPYMAPVPHRGKRNESAYAADVARKLAEAYGVEAEEVARATNTAVEGIFHIGQRTD